MSMDKLNEWQTLKNLQKDNVFTGQKLKQAYLSDCGLALDYSRHTLLREIVENLIALAKAQELTQKIDDLFEGKKINFTEDRCVSHWQYREPQCKQSKKIQQQLENIASWVEKLQKQHTYKHILCLGIGGSHLGPLMASHALEPFKNSHLSLHFLSNCDPFSVQSLLNKLNPKETFVLVSSKSFGTIETLTNAKTIYQWMKTVLGHQTWEQILAITAKPEKAVQWGILPENILTIEESVGGRYSIWSAMGLPLALSIGMENFLKFLDGGYLMDNHFKKTALEQNLPVILALLEIWHVNFENCHTQAVLPYCDRLFYFPQYLQQMAMESNGKQVDFEGNILNYSTCPVIWGGVGCDAQHAYMQLVHQSKTRIPVDFIVVASEAFNQPTHALNRQQVLLEKSALAQADALFDGCRDEKPHQKCDGNKPSNILTLKDLNPQTLGSLIALYEHKVFVQSLVWGINAFDQFGVELGKAFLQVNN